MPRTCRSRLCAGSHLRKSLLRRSVARRSLRALTGAGLIHLTRRMAVRLIRDHIVVTAIAPGPFKSDMNRAARDNEAEVATRVPSGRIGTDEDMAGAAIYLASRAGDYVVGATIAVDGGIVYANAGIKGDGWDS